MDDFWTIAAFLVISLTPGIMFAVGNYKARK